jgi:hypothetical protein
MQEEIAVKNCNTPTCSIFILLFVVTSITLTACAVYGPNTERKSALDMLSERNYQRTGSVLGVQIIKSKKRNTVIAGAVYIDDLVPLKFEKLRLINENGETVSETTTLPNGDFEFKDYIVNGKYVIKIVSEEYWGKREIKVDDYQLQDIRIKAEPNLHGGADSMPKR